MHMSDALISIPVATSFWTISIAGISYSSFKYKKLQEDRSIPLMAVMSALIFALQMVNFSIPASGSSGHFAGGFLLSIILGPYLAFLSMTSVLIVQALFFADGGLLALGCNIFNLAFIPNFVVYPIIKYISKNNMNSFFIWLGAFISLMLGASMVAFQTGLSGISEIDFRNLFYLMVSIHFFISIIEGVISVGVNNILQKSAILKSSEVGSKPLSSILILSVIIASILSLFASSSPDGLEWSLYRILGEGNEPTSAITSIHHIFQSIQNKLSFLPDYNFPSSENSLGTSVSGLIGSLITVIFASALGLLSKKYKKHE